MTHVEILHAVYAKLENRPGTLARAAQALGAKHVNVDAISLDTNGDQGFVRILTHKPREAVDALRSAGVDAFESELVVVALPNKPGELARAAAELAAAQINVEGIVTTPEGRLGIRASDTDRAATILRKL